MTSLSLIHRVPPSRRVLRRGSMLLEGALVSTFMFVPLMMGLYVVGFNMIRGLQVNQINRDAGHMFARGVDFATFMPGGQNDLTGQADQQVVFKMGSRLADSSAAGTGVMILSEIEYISTNECPSGCNNLNQPVFIQQNVLGNAALIVGNSGVAGSAFGTPPSTSLDSSGSSLDPLNDSQVRVSNGRVSIVALLGWALPANDGSLAFVSETYYSSADVSIPGFPSPPGVYARAIF